MKDITRLNDVLIPEDCDCGLLCDGTCKTGNRCGEPGCLFLDGKDCTDDCLLAESCTDITDEIYNCREDCGFLATIGKCDPNCVGLNAEPVRSSLSGDDINRHLRESRLGLKPAKGDWYLSNLPVMALWPEQWKTTTITDMPKSIVWDMAGVRGLKVMPTTPVALQGCLNQYGNCSDCPDFPQGDCLGGIEYENREPVGISEEPAPELVVHVASLDASPESPATTGTLQDIAAELANMRSTFDGISDMCLHRSDHHYTCNHFDGPKCCDFDECPRIGN